MGMQKAKGWGSLVVHGLNIDKWAREMQGQK